MEYLAEGIWYLSLPLTVWLATKFVQHNLKHFNKLERLEMYEKKAQQNTNTTPLV